MFEDEPKDIVREGFDAFVKVLRVHIPVDRCQLSIEGVGASIEDMGHALNG